MKSTLTDNLGIFVSLVKERIFFFKMADCVQAEVLAAKTKAFLSILALISRVLKQWKFKYDEWVGLNEQGQLFHLQMIAKMR